MGISSSLDGIADGSFDYILALTDVCYELTPAGIDFSHSHLPPVTPDLSLLCETLPSLFNEIYDSGDTFKTQVRYGKSVGNVFQHR